MRKTFCSLFFILALLSAARASGVEDFDPAQFPYEPTREVSVEALLLLDKAQKTRPFKISHYRKILKKVSAIFERKYGVRLNVRMSNYIFPRAKFFGARECSGDDFGDVFDPANETIALVRSEYFKNIPSDEYCFYSYDFLKEHLRRAKPDIVLTDYLLLSGDGANATGTATIVSSGVILTSSPYVETTLLSVFPFIGEYEFLKSDPRNGHEADELIDHLATLAARGLTRTMLHLEESTDERATQ